MPHTGMKPGAALTPRIPEEFVCTVRCWRRFRRRWRRIAAPCSAWRWKCAMRWQRMACG